MSRQPDMHQIMKKAQMMQQQLAAAQADLSEKTFDGTAGGGMVRAVVTGGQELVEIHISPEVVDPEDVEMLEDLIVAAVRQAYQTARGAVSEKFGGLSGGLDFGDLLG